MEIVEKRPGTLEVAEQRPPVRAHEAMEAVDRTIYILGTGSIGKLVAYALKGGLKHMVPAVTLLLHRPSLLEDFNNNNRSITMTTNDVEETRSGFDVELALPQRQDPGKVYSVGLDTGKFSHMAGSSTISNLVVTVKAHQTVSALRSIRHRLTPSSTICFLQNGMGIIEEVNDKVYPDPEERPQYMMGINSHGVHQLSNTSAVHAGHGVISLSLVRSSDTINPGEHAASVTDSPASANSTDMDKSSTLSPISSISEPVSRPIPPSAHYLLQQLTRPPVLAAAAIAPSNLLLTQLEKLAVNCLINPLTVMLDARNGDLLSNFALTRTMRLLLAEICTVFQALPELRGVPGVATRLSPQRLETMAVTVARKTGANISSMLADARRGVQTEIEYINGYVVRRGEELGIKCVMNYMLMQMVIGKQQLISREIENYTPVKHMSS